MKCKEKLCGGKVEVSSDKAISLQTGCGGGCGPTLTDAYPCNKCGSLHYDNGSSAVTRAEANVFLIEGRLVGKSFYPDRPVGKQVVIEPL